MAASLGTENSWKDHQSFRFESLRPIAQKQLDSLFRRMELTRDYSRYAEEIKKILIDEKKRQKNNSKI
ncbi:hypothetical protein ES705_31091 [subsurface metagenome]